MRTAHSTLPKLHLWDYTGYVVGYFWGKKQISSETKLISLLDLGDKHMKMT